MAFAITRTNCSHREAFQRQLQSLRLEQAEALFNVQFHSAMRELKSCSSIRDLMKRTAERDADGRLLFVVTFDFGYKEDADLGQVRRDIRSSLFPIHALEQNTRIPGWNWTIANELTFAERTRAGTLVIRAEYREQRYGSRAGQK
jgi:hypothetical protein